MQLGLQQKLCQDMFSLTNAMDFQSLCFINILSFINFKPTSTGVDKG